VVYGFDMTKRQMAVYVLCLLPLPFFLTSLGAFFVSVITVLNIAWSAIAVKGVFSKENKKYANTMFYFSLTYMTVAFGLMILIKFIYIYKPYNHIDVRIFLSFKYVHFIIGFIE